MHDIYVCLCVCITSVSLIINFFNKYLLNNYVSSTTISECKVKVMNKTNMFFSHRFYILVSYVYLMILYFIATIKSH